MNIILVSHCNFLGQSSYHVHSIAKELTALGCYCIICVPDGSGSADQQITPAVPIMNFEDALKQGIGFPDGCGPTLIHCWTPREHVRQFTDELVQRYQCPYVVHLEDNEWEILRRTMKGLGYEEVEKLDPDSQDAVIPHYCIHPARSRPFMENSAGCTVLMDRLLEYVPEDIAGLVFWPGYDDIFNSFPDPSALGLRNKYGIASDAFIVLYCGAFHKINKDEIKGMLLALSEYKEECPNLFFLKTGYNLLPELIESAGLNGFIKDIGFIPRHQMPELLAIADVIIQPGIGDAFNDYRFPSKLPEALISGKPVVLPRSNIGRFLVSGLEALVTDRDTAESVIHHLRALYASPDWRKNIGYNGRRFAHKHLQWSIAAQNILNFYKEVYSAGAAAKTHRDQPDISKVTRKLAKENKVSQLRDYKIKEKDAQIETLCLTLGKQKGQIELLIKSMEALDVQIGNLHREGHEKDNQINLLKQEINKLDVQVEDLNARMLERDDSISSLNSLIAETNERINALVRSSSWRLTKPFRLGKRLLCNILHPVDAYRLNQDVRLIKDSHLFDAEYYVACNRDILDYTRNPISHYCKFGWKEGRNPSRAFNTRLYMLKNPDVDVANINPLVHYLRYGSIEGRRTWPVDDK
jgi:glycosyltransferase involved in cell wall biosynthesis